MAAPDRPAAAPVATRLLDWFDRCGRHDLPWQHPRTPYRVWLSEVMLQQTQVRTVVPYFQRFVEALPDLRALAAADADTVLALWSGLGYYSRARNLHAAARLCVQRHDGELPRDVRALSALPGIGASTAAAIAAQAWNDRHAILDGNVKRVLARYHGIDGWPGLPRVERELWAHARRHVADAALPDDRLADYTQAQMDLGATVCTRSRPACAICPLQADCAARIHGRTDELPTPRPSRELPRRQAHALLALDASTRVLLQRRPPTGVWASLWSLPQFDDAAVRDAWLAAHLDTETAPEAMAPVEHTFSHYHLMLHPQRLRARMADRAADDPDLAWVDADSARNLGIPAPVRRLIERILEE
ncbi:A/G-specific adenine glycosylase [Lysobacter sp. N42]|uniref:A/G-specific adenine glycosylase n=1 Tax=Lysobacter sp. N42 TaxID=2545719 RepID=UPI001045B3A2|nr:A/G-specific adenine glycosylase [Lysobacter sp. N42]TCZ88059.1 A/G-specific adenine glycosylase [Lysobacter sp. N42]